MFAPHTPQVMRLITGYGVPVAWPMNPDRMQPTMIISDPVKMPSVMSNADMPNPTNSPAAQV
jgi:hypothetical protein